MLLSSLQSSGALVTQLKNLGQGNLLLKKNLIIDGDDDYCHFHDNNHDDHVVNDDDFIIEHRNTILHEVIWGPAVV